MTAREIIAALQCGKARCACARGAVVHCANRTGHKNGDANPSLGIGEQGGKVLIRCYSGCSQDDVITALKDRGLWGEQAAAPVIPIRAGGGQLTRTYEYHNADGVVIAEHGRFEQAGGGKSFAWRVPGKEWRDGLGSIALHDLPLYRLLDVLEHPFETVWVCEGEKAVDACREHGLVAVCLGGGANQQAFGNTLDVLRDRAVVLWPDNDEAGAAFMGRLHALLPDARFVRPVLPEKADAFDYFAAGGTPEGLLQLLEDAAPAVTVMGRDAITVSIPVASGRIRFEFTSLQSGPRAIDAELRIVVDVPGKRRTPFSTRLNLESSSGREGTKRELQNIFPGKDIEWAVVLSEACDLAKETWRGIDYSVDLADVALPEERVWAIDKFAPAYLPTIVFGMGGSGKSYLLADMGLHCLYGMPWKGRRTETCEAILVIDYEDREDEWRLRVQQLCDGYGWDFPERGYRYMPGMAIPIADQMSRLRKVVADNSIELVIVDSAASAVGGELSDPQAVARMVNALTDLGPTVFVIAHNTKAEDSNYPFGSIFWHNLVRATHYVEATQDEGSNVVELAIYNRKSNRGKQKPIGMRMTFDQHSDMGPVSIELTASIPQSLQSESQGDRWEIMKCLEREGRLMTAKEIAEHTGIKEASVRAQLSKGIGKWFANPQRGVWGLISRREEGA